MKYVSLVLLGLLMAVLAGCGGGGDGGKGDKITELTADLEAALGKLSTTEQTLKTTQGELTTTKGTLSTTRDELSTTKETLSTAQETLSTTQGQLTTTQGELKTTQGQLSATQGELETTEDSLTITQDVLETTQDELKMARATLATTKTQLETAQQDLASKETALNTLVLKAGVEDVTALSAQLDAYKTVQNQVDALLLKAGVETLTALSTKLDTDDDAYDDLQTEVQGVLTATGMTTLAALQTEYDTTKTKYTNLNAQVQATLTATNSASLTALQTTVAGLREKVSDLEEDVKDANKKAQDVQNTADKQISTLEQTTRSRGLLSALKDTTGLLSTTSKANVEVKTRNNLSIKAPNYTSSGISGAPSGFRAARLKRNPGGSQLEIVAYTDREVSRTLLDHYGDMRASATALQIDMNDSDWGDSPIKITNSTDVQASKGPRVVSHGFLSTKSVPATDTTLDDNNDLTTTKSATSYSGNIHGVPGTFRCGTADCKVTLTATYTSPTITDPKPDTENTKHSVTAPLGTVTLTAATGNVYFKPSSASGLVYLYSGGAAAGIAEPDGQYMVFGWWKNTPTVATGTYDFEAFAYASTTASFGPGTATYDGPAVGAYVEEGVLAGASGGARHGEFTATAHLTATSSAVSGYVDGFEATQEGSGSAVVKPWRVNLLNDDNDDNTVDIALVNLTGTTAGSWSHQFVGNHTHTRAAQPVAAVGTFNASIPNLLHLTGAFGVHRRTTDQTE